jgi:aminopeptidase N
MALPRFPSVLQIFCTLAVFLYCCTANSASATETEVEYDLSISFQPAGQLLNGTARIVLHPGSGINLNVAGLFITGIILRYEDGRESIPATPAGSRFSLPAADGKRELFISYQARTEGSADNLISPDGITLTHLWHPVPDRALLFRLQARLPEGFTAITESDVFPLPGEGDTVSGTLSQPLQNLHFAAGPYVGKSLEVRRGLQVHSLFFPEDQELARGYLEAAARYLQRYEQEIGPFPYPHYVIAANRRPTGLGMPTFTLLGQQVLRLPFIKDTSLGHEIVHSWFGNSVEVDPSGGNWCEGLTTFLADHAYRADQGQAALDRKERIVGYLSYVNDQTAIPLSAFRSADHRSARAEALRATGYNRSTLLFAELREMLGPEAFTRAVQGFYRVHRNESASWDDLQQSFSRAASRDLGGFFRERLDRSTIPELAASEIEVRQKDGKTFLHFQLEQKTEQPFSLQVPIHVTTSSGTSRFLVTSDKAGTAVSLTTNGLPLQFSIDPEYTFMRRLTAAEMPPVWSRFLGAEKKLVILESEAGRSLYGPLLESLADSTWTVKTAAEVQSSELSGSSLLFLGTGHPLSRSLFARPQHPATGFTLDVRHHPLDSGQVAVLISSSDPDETAAVGRRLSHYGKYSYLHFEKGRNTRQQTTETESGIVHILEQLPVGAATAALNPFAEIMAQLDDRRVVFIGETHTSMADHRLQLRIIEAMYRKNPDMAIGMEMFPTTSQAALDSYTVNRTETDERGFLKASRYFQVWRYDYRYYREIINFAREKRLPIIGINLENDTVSTVFKTGSIDALPENIKKSLPIDRDLSMAGYADWLGIMHDMHAGAGHGNGSLSGFIQAQALWDESMAENIALYLQRNPGRRMALLAGSQHCRRDTGIPPRLQRRLPLTQATVLNISEEPPGNLAAMADYYFVSQEIPLPDAAKMGIVLESGPEGSPASLRITGFSPSSKAEEAGLRKEDVLLDIDGLGLRDMDDVRIALLDARPGQKVVLGIERGGKEGETKKRLEYTIELIQPSADRPHP